MANIADIARDMEAQARRGGRAERDLARGLNLVLVWCGGQKTLCLSRPVVRPSDQEELVCRQAFGVPEDAAREEGQVSITLRWES